MTVGKPPVIAKLDDVATYRHYEIELAATKVPQADTSRCNELDEIRLNRGHCPRRDASTGRCDYPPGPSLSKN